MVSIIIPNYNGAEWLKETLDSCLRQDPEYLTEVIIVDDHSTDNSWDIIQSYSIKTPLIKAFQNSKKGANSARNYGFLKSKGQYIQFLDVDDLLSENKIKVQVRSIQNSADNTVATCGWAHFKRSPAEAVFSPSKTWKSYDQPIDWLIDTWTTGGMMVTSCWLTPRELIIKSGLWDESLLKNQDGEFFCRVLLKANKVKFVEEAKVYYRKPGKENVSQRVSYEAAQSLLHSYQNYEKNIRQVKDDKAVRMACAQNYLKFIYQFHPLYPKLIQEAQQAINKLNIEKKPLVGGNRFKKISQIVGFNNALILRQLFNL